MIKLTDNIKKSIKTDKFGQAKKEFIKRYNSK